MSTADIAARWHAVQARVAAAAIAVGRSPADITVVAVGKFHPAADVAAVAAAGAVDIGENYVQELVGKQAELATLPVTWHFIGRLQRNKARAVAGQVALIHAVDSLELAIEIGKRAAARATTQPILLAINAAGEASKGGIELAAAPALLDLVATLPGVRVDGFMTMPPPDDDPRPYFLALRQLRDTLATAARPLPILSMGMSDDLDVAIACGATHVRIGTAIFGPRPAAPPVADVE